MPGFSNVAATLILISSFIVSLPTTVAQPQDGAAVRALIDGLPTRIASPIALFRGLESPIREEAAVVLLNTETHPLCALLTLLDSSPQGGIVAAAYVDYMSVQSCEALGPELLRRVKSTNLKTRQKACELLDSLPYAAVSEPRQLRILLRDRHPIARRQACQLLGKIGISTAEAIEMLRILMYDTTTDVRCAAIEAIGTLEATGAFPKFSEQTTDTEFAVRLATVLVLAKLDSGDASNRRLLAQLYRESPDELTRKRLLKAVIEFGKEAIIFREFWKRMIRDASELTTLSQQLEMLGPGIVDLCAEMLLESEREEGRWSALLLLQWTKHDTSAVRPLVSNCLHENSKRLQLRALLTLAAIGNVRVDEVQPFLNGGAGFRIAAAKALGQCSADDHERAVLLLLSLLNDEHEEVWGEAIHSLSRYDIHPEDSLKRLTSLLAPGREPGVADILRVIAILQDHGSGAAIAAPELILTFANRKLLRRFYSFFPHYLPLSLHLQHSLQQLRPLHPAVEALVAIGKPAVPRLTEALLDDNKDIRQMAKECLLRIDHPHATAAVAEDLWTRAMSSAPADENPVEIALALDGGASEKLRGDTSSLPSRLGKLVKFPRYSLQALQILSCMGPAANDALPELQRYYTELRDTVMDGQDASTHRMVSIRMATARCIYQVSGTATGPLFAEAEQCVLPVSRFIYEQASLLLCACDSGFQSQSAVARSRELLQGREFMPLDHRAYHSFVLANLDPANSQWRATLESMALRKVSSMQFAVWCLELMAKQNQSIATHE